MANFNDLINQATKQEDFTEVSKGGDFERILPDAGMGVCRFREYIELGSQETATKLYPNKKPARKARFVFELTTPKHVREVEKEDKTKIKIPHVLGIEVVISKSEKSNFIKLFKQLNWRGDATHPAQLLGQPYLCEVVHAWARGDDPKKTKPSYANLQKDGVYTFQAPRKVDPLAGTTEELKVPELLGDLKLFLYDIPTKETWDSLFIDGTREKDGVEVSKNWLQEKILSATDFEGSALEAMLNDLGELSLTEKPNDNKADVTEQKNVTVDVKDPIKDPMAELGI